MGRTMGELETLNHGRGGDYESFPSFSKVTKAWGICDPIRID